MSAKRFSTGRPGESPAGSESVAGQGVMGPQRIAQGKLKPLPGPSEAAADGVYVATATKLGDGLEAVLKGYEKADNAEQRKMHALWVKAGR